MGERARGYAYTFFAFVLWGILPLFWKTLEGVPALEILCHRIFWSLLTVNLLSWKRKDPWDYVKKPALRRLTILTALAISTNWGVYIFSINAGYLVEASLGYYISPLVLILMGIIFLKERMEFTEGLAFVLAFLGVSYRTLQHGRLPFVAIVLATSFGLYALLKKKFQLDGRKSLLAEVFYLTPPALGYILFQELRGEGHFLSSFPANALLLSLSGLVTVLPLSLYAEGVARVPLVSVGFIQFIGPSLMLLIGVFLFGEPFDWNSLVTFSLIWSSSLLYALSNIHKSFQKRRRAP